MARIAATKRTWINRTAVASLIVVSVLALAESAQGATRRHRKRGAFQVALQPFSLVQAAVHAVAEPVVNTLPRMIFEELTVPTEEAYFTSHRIRRNRPPPPDSSMDEAELSDDREPRTTAVERRIRRAEPVRDGELVRVAYVVPRAQPWIEEREEEEETVEEPDLTDGAKPMVNGSRAVLRNGVAYAPSEAPQRVKRAIWAANSLRRKPYEWGGGHGSFVDSGYDCSGSVSFALHGAGALSSPLPSSDFMRYGERGRGRWITIYSRRGHTFAVIAGLRWDTTDFREGGNTGPRWYVEGRDTGGFVARHPAGM